MTSPLRRLRRSLRTLIARTTTHRHHPQERSMSDSMPQTMADPVEGAEAVALATSDAPTEATAATPDAPESPVASPRRTPNPVSQAAT